MQGRSKLNTVSPIVNKRISVTPIALIGGAACKTPEDFATIAAAPDGSGFRLIAQPFVVAFSVGLGILHNGQSVLDKMVSLLPDGSGAAQKLRNFGHILPTHTDDVIMNSDLSM